MSITHVDTGKLLSRSTKTDTKPINALQVLSETMIATGGETGRLKLWDTRLLRATTTEPKPVMEWREHMDYISDIQYVPHKKTLFATSADGFMSLYDIRAPSASTTKGQKTRKGYRVLAKSDQQEDELLSVTFVKNFKKVIVGSGEGILNIFTWGQWKDSTDRMPGHPSSVETLLKIDESTIATGSSDGIIRVIGILPNKLLGVIGDHGEFPIEQLDLSWDSRWMGSVSHDGTVRLWNVGELYGVPGDYGRVDDDDEEEEEAGVADATALVLNSDDQEQQDDSGDEDDEAEEFAKQNVEPMSSNDSEELESGQSSNSDSDPEIAPQDDSPSILQTPTPAKRPAESDEDVSASSDDEDSPATAAIPTSKPNKKKEADSDADEEEDNSDEESGEGSDSDSDTEVEKDRKRKKRSKKLRRGIGGKNRGERAKFFSGLF